MPQSREQISIVSPKNAQSFLDPSARHYYKTPVETIRDLDGDDGSDSTTYGPDEVQFQRKKFKLPFLKSLLNNRQNATLGEPHAHHCTISLADHSGAAEAKLAWKPQTLRAPVLGSFVFFSIVFIIILEALSHISLRNDNSGALVFAADVNSLPTGAIFGYMYLPTVIAVFYSMVWSWVDLDAKRLEPWFQLSKNGGETADGSLNLQYPFDFLPFIPLAALRRKHFAVFFAGTIMLMIFWVVTPLQSAIFNTGVTTLSTPTEMIYSAVLPDIEEQTSSLNISFLDTAFGVTWLDQKIPPFTTLAYATSPFKPTSEASLDVGNQQTWSSSVQAYSTSLNCTPAIVSRQTNPSYYTFDNGRGCVVPDIGLTQTSDGDQFLLQYFSYYSDPHVDSSLQNPNCSAQHANNFLAIWATNMTDQPGIYGNMTALFCVPNYHIQSMAVTVNASNQAIIEPIENTMAGRTDLPTGIFNTTQFEYVVGTGSTPTQERQNVEDSVVLQQYPRLGNYSLAFPVSNTVGFAVGLGGVSMEELSSPYSLHLVFEKAHKLLFSAAFSTLATSSPDFSQPSWSGVRTTKPGAILLVRPIAIVVEVALGVIAILTVSLWYFTYCRHSRLLYDPASVADTMSITGPESAMVECQECQTSMKQKYQLENNGAVVKLTSVATTETKVITVHNCLSEIPNKSRSEPETLIRPRESRLLTGSILIAMLLGSIAALTYLQVQSARNNGFALPSTNPIVLSILENYLPTAFATFLEPTWVILNRLLCLLQPFEELRKGNAKFSKSIGAKYTSLPPQLTILSAIRSGHIILAAVGAISISTNVLAVALAGIFEERLTTTSIPSPTTSTLFPQINQTAIDGITKSAGPNAYQDHYYVALSNLSHGTVLPPWTDENFYYLPFSLRTMDQNILSSQQLQGYYASTIGFGAEVQCDELLPGAQANGVKFAPFSNGSTTAFETTHQLFDNTTVTCTNGAGLGSTPNSFAARSSLAFEVMETMNPLNDDKSQLCRSQLLAGWGRGRTIDEGTQIQISQIDSTFIGCNSRFYAANFSVLVDSDGHILHSEKIGSISGDATRFFRGNDTDEASFNAQMWGFVVNLGAYNNDLVWHNDSISQDWINSLLDIANGSNSLVDPTKPVPAANDVGPRVESLCKLLFAIVLGLNSQIFLSASDANTVAGNIVVLETRIFMASAMTNLCIAVLACHFMMAVVYYALRPKVFLPRMPTSIAAVMSYVQASRIYEDGKAALKENRYGYGRYVGTDGETHVGIERQRYVVPWASENPDVKRRKWALLRKETDESQPDIWI